MQVELPNPFALFNQLLSIHLGHASVWPALGRFGVISNAMLYTSPVLLLSYTLFYRVLAALAHFGPYSVGFIILEHFGIILACFGAFFYVLSTIVVLKRFPLLLVFVLFCVVCERSAFLYHRSSFLFNLFGQFFIDFWKVFSYVLPTVVFCNVSEIWNISPVLSCFETF